MRLVVLSLHVVYTARDNDQGMPTPKRFVRATGIVTHFLGTQGAILASRDIYIKSAFGRSQELGLVRYTHFVT